MTDDRILVAKILKNDEQAFGALVAKYQKMVYATCFRLVRTQTDAEDLSQEVFIEVFRSLSQVQKEHDLSGWLFKIAMNKSLSFLRKHNPAKSNQNTTLESTVLDITGKNPLSETSTPFSKLEEEDTRKYIFKAIDQLPENQKKAILLHKFDNFSQKEISDQMGLSQVSVESLIYRAKTNLRKTLFDYFKKHYR
jgi:RNA polymerase sigma-70 factor (ECF subfamily)